MTEWTPEKINEYKKLYASFGDTLVCDALSEIERLRRDLSARDEVEAAWQKRMNELKELDWELVTAGNFMHDSVANFTKENNWEMLRKWRILIALAQEVLK